MRHAINLSHITTGFIAVLVGYSSSAVIVFKAAETAGANPAQISSWLWALGIGMGTTSIGLSLYYKNPVLTAWSTPGSALLVTSLSGIPLSEAIGAFLFCSLLITFVGISGWFEKIMSYVPVSLTSAMLAGVLFRFSLDLFIAIETQLVLTGSMIMGYLLLKQFIPRYTIPIVLCIGLFIAALKGLLNFENLDWQLTQPVLMMPSLSLSAIISISIPLFIVTMTSQNVPGLAAIRANGYNTPSSAPITWTGIAGLILAPFGGFAFNLAAITAAICMGKESDSDPKKRYLTTIWAGVFYLLTGIFAATVVSLFTAFPSELVIAIAGLALISTIGNALASALKDENKREAAIITFMMTASGISIFGIGSAFWGIVVGLIAHRLTTYRTNKH